MTVATRARAPTWVSSAKRRATARARRPFIRDLRPRYAVMATVKTSSRAGCEAPPRNCFLKKGSSKGKCFDECPDDKAYECYEEECKGTGKDCDDDDECCSGRECFATKDGKGTCEKQCPDDDKYECYEAPCKGTGGKCEEDDDCCSGRSCFTKGGKDGTCEKECPDDDKYDCYEEPCADKGDRCGDDDDCCDSNECFKRKDGKGTCLCGNQPS